MTETGERQQGITPAWAGKRQRPAICWTLQGDHPRVGGEKNISRIVWYSFRGSPPRGRGKVLCVALCIDFLGITPAWAGKRYWKQLFTLPQLGSPPRGRGKECGDTACTTHHGITPAWAGKRLKRSHRSGIFISGPIPFHSVLHRPAGSGGSLAGRDGSPAGQPQNAGPA